MFVDLMRRFIEIIEEIDIYLFLKFSFFDQNLWVIENFLKRFGLLSEEVGGLDSDGVVYFVGGDGKVFFGCNDKSVILKFFMYDFFFEFYYGMFVVQIDFCK